MSGFVLYPASPMPAFETSAFPVGVTDLGCRSKDNLEQLNAVPFSGVVRIE